MPHKESGLAEQLQERGDRHMTAKETLARIMDALAEANRRQLELILRTMQNILR